MQPQIVVLVFVLFGVASCALAIGRSGRASLLLAAGGAAALAALGAGAGNPAGVLACAALAAGALGCALLAGPWLGASPLGPLATIASMGLYLQGASSGGAGGALLPLLAAALFARPLFERALSRDAAQVGATALALGILGLGLASGAGRVAFARWALDAPLLACPLLAASLAGAFSARGGERRDVVVALAAAGALLAGVASYAEACVLLAVAGALFVANAPSRPRALLGALVGTVAVALAGVNLAPLQFKGWLRAPTDVYGSGFDLHVFLGTLKDASPVGAGVVDPATMATADSARVYVLGQAVSAFGWAGLALPLVCVASVAIACLRALPALSPAEKNLGLALLGTFGAFAAGNVVYVFHLLPVPAMPFPLLSPDTSPMLTFVLLGVTLARVAGGRPSPEEPPAPTSACGPMPRPSGAPRARAGRS